ncbi:hypothetical protein H4R19_000816 [Coemansia spiralis]|nr:hypothetical protein H4R19_000816 [Coemansia spiralis]
MASEINLFVAVAAAVVVLSVALMLIARRFKGVLATEPAASNPAHGQQQQLQLLPPRIVVHLRSDARPSKAYNPFSEDELQLLHTVTLASAPDGALEPSGAADGPYALRYASADCSICLLPYTAGDTLHALACGHVYHAKCIDVWLTERSARCPICKADARKALGLASRPPSLCRVASDPGPQTPPARLSVDVAVPQPARLAGH